MFYSRFQVSVYNFFFEKNSEELFHIIIDKVNGGDSNNNSAYYYDNASNFYSNEYKDIDIVSVINNPEEWARIVNIESLESPSAYNIFSNDLTFGSNIILILLI